MKEVFLVIPITAILVIGSLQAGCSYDTTFICMALILAGYIASKD